MPDSLASAGLPLAPPPPAPTPRLARFLALEDFDAAARRRLPRMIYGYVAGAVETGAARRDAAAAYDEYAIIPRTLTDTTGRSLERTLFGRRYAAPFGVPPLGGSAMVAYRGDIVLAEAARAMDVPMIMSAASLIPLEEVRHGRPNTWMQVYLAGDFARIDPMIDRVAAAGFDTLVVTADTPVPGNRENNVRNGFSVPIRLTSRTIIDSALHPLWLLGTIGRTFRRHGAPYYENMDAQRGNPLLSQTATRNLRDRDGFSWAHVEHVRKRWPGTLVVKGLLAAEDARRARSVGVDGIIVSNHGGRQLDYAIAPLTVLPEMVEAAAGMPVMIDGGIRRGTDVLKALALGAAFVFVGRPFLFAAAVAGEAGVRHAMSLLAAEISRDMAMMGLNRLHEVGPDWVRRRCTAGWPGASQGASPGGSPAASRRAGTGE